MILIGSFMARGIQHIRWTDPTEAVPAFLTILVMPLTVSITDGIAFGLISYSMLKLIAGRAGEAHWLIHLFAGLLALRYVVE